MSVNEAGPFDYQDAALLDLAYDFELICLLGDAVIPQPDQALVARLNGYIEGSDQGQMNRVANTRARYNFYKEWGWTDERHILHDALETVVKFRPGHPNPRNVTQCMRILHHEVGEYTPRIVGKHWKFLNFHPYGLQSKIDAIDTSVADPAAVLICKTNLITHHTVPQIRRETARLPDL